MPNLIRRRKSKKQRALSAAGDAIQKVVKIRISWAAAKTTAKVAVPAAVVAGGAAIAKRRSGGHTPATA